MARRLPQSITALSLLATEIPLLTRFHGGVVAADTMRAVSKRSANPERFAMATTTKPMNIASRKSTNDRGLHGSSARFSTERQGVKRGVAHRR